MFTGLFLFMRLFFWLCIGFIVAVPVGTLSHESGHFLAARVQGLKAFLHYNSTSYSCTNPEGKAVNDFLISAGGPVVTDLIFILAFVILLLRKSTISERGHLNLADWVIVFLSLFCLRNLFNIVMVILYCIIPGRGSSDEQSLSRQLGMAHWVLPLVFAVISASVLAFVFFSIIPRRQRTVFNCATFWGSLIGYIIWFVFLGPLLLPPFNYGG